MSTTLLSTKTIIQKRTFVCVDLGENNNKTWRITQYDDHSLLKEWGRVAEDGSYAQSKPFGPFASQERADREFESACEEKKRGKRNPSDPNGPRISVYREWGGVDTGRKSSVQMVERSALAQLATQQIVTNSPETMALVKLLTDRNIHNITTSTKISYNAHQGFTTPLGVITPEQVIEARAKLDAIANLLTSSALDTKSALMAANEYLMIVPQDYGRSRLEVRDLFGSQDLIIKQNGILDALEVSFSTITTESKNEEGEVTVQEPIFKAKLLLVDDMKEIERITKKYYATHKGYHTSSRLKPKRVFSVEIGPMHDAFNEKGKQIGNIQELWHGTATANLLSILKSGLKISPPSTASIAGKNFGHGLYFSDQSTKSLNYAHGYWRGASENTCYMFLVDVAMGNPYMARTTNNWTKAPEGYHSCFCEGGKCSGLMNNEMIVYSEYQADPVYLVEFSDQ